MLYNKCGPSGARLAPIKSWLLSSCLAEGFGFILSLFENSFLLLGIGRGHLHISLLGGLAAYVPQMFFAFWYDPNAPRGAWIPRRVAPQEKPTGCFNRRFCMWLCIGPFLVFSICLGHIFKKELFLVGSIFRNFVSRNRKIFLCAFLCWF